MTRAFKRRAHFIHKKMTLFREAAAAAGEWGAGAQGGAGGHLPPSCAAAAPLARRARRLGSHLPARPPSMRGLWPRRGTKGRLFGSRPGGARAHRRRPPCVRPRPRPEPAVPGGGRPSRPAWSLAARVRVAASGRSAGPAGGRARCSSKAAARVRSGSGAQTRPRPSVLSPRAPSHTSDVRPNPDRQPGPRSATLRHPPSHLPAPRLEFGAHPSPTGQKSRVEGREAEARGGVTSSCRGQGSGRGLMRPPRSSKVRAPALAEAGHTLGSEAGWRGRPTTKLSAVSAELAEQQWESWKRSRCVLPAAPGARCAPLGSRGGRGRLKPLGW